MDPSVFRNLVKEASGRDISTEQAKSFLEILGDDLNAAINQATREFINKHFGEKNKK